MSGPVDASGLPSELGAFDLLMHRGEANPRTPSPLLRRRSLSTRTEAIEMELSHLNRAARAAEGSINNYHAELGVPVNSLPMAVPVNLRAEADPGGGNRFAGVNLAAPIGVADPAIRIGRIRKQMISRREEAAIDFIGAVAPVLSLLPDPGDYVTVTTRYDRAAVAHPDPWAQCRRRGFDEVLALSGDPAARVVPASFPGEPADYPRHKNGSVAYS